MSRFKSAWSVFLIALFARVVLFVAVLPNPEVIFQPDSRIYTTLAETFHEHGTFFQKEKPTPAYLVRTPGYPLFILAVSSIFGDSPLGIILIQILVDSLTCFVIFHISEMVWRGTGYISGYLASCSLGMITYSHFILSDALFLFVFTLASTAFFKACSDSRWKWFWLVGIGFGASTMVRSVSMYLPLFVVVLYFLVCRRAGKLNVRVAVGRSAIIGIIYLVVLAPWILYVHSVYGRFGLTAQAGEHLLQYVVPSVMQYSSGVPLIEGMKKVDGDFQHRASQTGMDVESANPFDVSGFQVRMALEYLGGEPKSAILKAWIFGAVKNMFSPSVIDFSYLMRIERPRFSYTEGATTMARAFNFMKGMEGWFGWALIGNIIVLVLSRIVQAWGLIQMMRRKRLEATVFILIIGYFVLISGPVGYAKYRLPFEPLLIVLLAIGLKDLKERLRLEERFASLTLGWRQKRQSV